MRLLEMTRPDSARWFSGRRLMMTTGRRYRALYQACSNTARRMTGKVYLAILDARVLVAFGVARLSIRRADSRRIARSAIVIASWRRQVDSARFGRTNSADAYWRIRFRRQSDGLTGDRISFGYLTTDSIANRSSRRPQGVAVVAASRDRAENQQQAGT